MISGYIFDLLVFVNSAFQENMFAIIEVFPKLFSFFTSLHSGGNTRQQYVAATIRDLVTETEVCCGMLLL